MLFSFGHHHLREQQLILPDHSPSQTRERDFWDGQTGKMEFFCYFFVLLDAVGWRGIPDFRFYALADGIREVCARHPKHGSISAASESSRWPSILGKIFLGKSWSYFGLESTQSGGTELTC